MIINSRRSNDVEAFIALIKAGLWESEALLSQYGDIDFSDVFRMADDQSVIGLVAAGIEHVADIKVPQETALSFVGYALQLEQRNNAMNSFVEKIYAHMQKGGMYSILVKGQGIAQCYERPLWRSSGDIDLLLNGDNYDHAKEWIKEIGEISEEKENGYRKRLNVKVGTWDVELHGTLRGELGGKIDNVIDEVQRDVFYGGNVRSWFNGNTSIFLPSPDNDVIFVFTHILQHFFRGGIGLRQICDWCRLLWTYRLDIDKKLLKLRLKKMNVMSEWSAFASFAVCYLGMQESAMPFYDTSKGWKHKAEKILEYILETGNFGFNRDLSYKATSSYWRRMAISFSRRTGDFIKQARVFPLDACRAYMGIWKSGLHFVFKRQ